jgi:hypothetical protein
MSEKPISPLRQRMIEDMTVRNFGEKTRNDYIRHVALPALLGMALAMRLRPSSRWCAWQMPEAASARRGPQMRSSYESAESAQKVVTRFC